jgi:ubiquinone/menaquinone biosynthesis C-methylase UbiE
MPDETFWRERYQQLGPHSVGPGNTTSDAELDAHKQQFLLVASEWLSKLNGPVLDFGCGVGRWVNNLPRPYVGLDLLPEHLDTCRAKYVSQSGVDFQHSSQLAALPDKHFNAIFTCTVLQHIVEGPFRKNILREFKRILSRDGIFLSIEWADRQKEYDWCTAVRQRELSRWFTVRKVGEVVEDGRRSNVWICTFKKNFFLR